MMLRNTFPNRNSGSRVLLELNSPRRSASPSSSVVAVSDWRATDGSRKSSLHRGGFEVRRQLQAQVVEQDRLVVRGASHATFADVRTLTRGQHDVDDLQARQFVQHTARFVAQAGF